MQVKLTNDVAKGGDIDLVHPCMSFQESRGPPRLVHQSRLVRQLKIDQFDQAFPPGHENEPWPAGVVHQQHAAETQVADDERITREPVIKRERHGVHARP